MNALKNTCHWRLGVVAGAIALMGSLAILPAHALGLGRIHVQSSLGEPLRAEIDIAEITTEEAASLRARIAAPEVFRSAGLDYNIVLSDLQITLNRRADGRQYLRLTGSRTVSEPFVDLVLEASWSSGRIVRDYTMLFDPPALRQQGLAGAPTAPMLSRPAAPAGSLPPPASAPPATAAQAVRPLTPQASQQTPAPQRAPTPVPRPASRQQLAVKSGDTAGGIAAQNKPANVSLDQMLVALLRNNPDAFIGANVNRLKAGAVLELPSAEQAGTVTPSEASRTIVAQSRDFSDFRRKLAENVSTTQVGSAGRTAGGQVQARVEDRAPAAATPDKLTLSKGAVQGRSAAEDKIARDRQASEAAQRTAELSKNISDLNKLGAGAPAGTSAAPGTRTIPGVTVPAAGPAAGIAPAASAAASAVPATSMPPGASSTPSATVSASMATATSSTTSSAAATSPASAAAGAASAPAPAAEASAAGAALPASAAASAPAPSRAPVAAAPAAPVAEPGLLDELTENPLVLPGLAALLLLLAGLGFYKYRTKRNSQAQVDSSFLESRLQPDSFFGASGGQRVDTNEGGATGSSLVYSPSQLDAAGDVDPVAEADVYLAYGRDLQAEEILKEAMRTNPARVAIHSKLLEIYAKRRDARAFEVVAVEAFNLTNGEGPEWTYIGELGRELDASNPMYQPGGQPSKAERPAPAEAHGSAAGFGSSTIPQMIEPERVAPAAPSPSLDFDLDLDFSLGDEPAQAPAPAPVPAPAPASASRPAEATMPIAPAPEAMFQGLDMDFSTDTIALKPPAAKPDASLSKAAPAPAVDPVLSASGLTFNPDATKPLSQPSSPFASTPAASDGGMLEFDLGSLSLDLDANTPGTAAEAHDDPLETKFALAEEFRSLGDSDGARSLAEEVVAEAKGSLKTKAQAFLASLS